MLKPPPVVGLVERRLLVNYRVDPRVTARLLPPPLRPQVVNGWSVAGICLIRLGQLRPRHAPRAIGLRSENAAHRFAVEWDTADRVATGVYIPRRDSDSLLHVLIGGRLFPGKHHRARFDVRESVEDVHVGFAGTDGTAAVRAHARRTSGWTATTLFATLEAASEFFRRGSAGYSATGDGHCLDGLELQTSGWQVEPAEIVTAHSSFFADTTMFPAGSVALDCALLMRDLPVTWNPLPAMPLAGP